MTCSPGTNSSSGMGSGVSGSLSNQGDSNFLEMKPKQMTLEDFCKGKKKISEIFVIRNFSELDAKPAIFWNKNGVWNIGQNLTFLRSNCNFQHFQQSDNSSKTRVEFPVGDRYFSELRPDFETPTTSPFPGEDILDHK